MSLLMSSKMSFKMSPKMSLKLKDSFTERELDKERIFEIRVRNLRTKKQKSFSILFKSGKKDKDLPSVEELRDFFENAYHEAKK